MTDPNEPMLERLGRQPAVFDPHNLDHLTRPLLAQREVVRKDTYWRMPDGRWPLDQGNSPKCTGFGMAHEAACNPIVIPGVDTAWAQHRYDRNVEFDHAAGRFFSGGATVQATMAAAKVDGVVSGYVWNLGIEDTIDALCTVGPQCLGTGWKNSMFRPRPDGLLQVTGADVGGHFYLAAAWVESHPRFGPGAWIVNSWGGWGVGVPELGLTTGCAFLAKADLALLLAEDGESVCARDLFDPPKAAPFFATKRGLTFHDAHPLLRRDREFRTYAEATASGLRPCKLCRPQP